jgi:hypothetical protein
VVSGTRACFPARGYLPWPCDWVVGWVSVEVLETAMESPGGREQSGGRGGGPWPGQGGPARGRWRGAASTSLLGQGSLCGWSPPEGLHLP